jgi:hypothetical protein
MSKKVTRVGLEPGSRDPSPNFPDMKGSKAQQSKEKFKLWKRKLYHRVWAEVLSSIRDVHLDGE